MADPQMTDVRKNARAATLALTLLTLYWTVAASRAAQDQRAIYDFMVMDVCIDNHGRPVPAVSPVDANCRNRRDIKLNEAPPYDLRNYNRAQAPCADEGLITKHNIPLERAGTVRIVSSTFRGGSSSCGRSVQHPEREGISIQWFDEEYGFIMGSWSPVALSSFLTPRCRNDHFSSSRFGGWIIAPSRVPQLGGAGLAVVESQRLSGRNLDLRTTCPTSYRRSLTTWTIQNVTYKSGATLESIVSSHYSQVGKDSQSPGSALQVERTYWTREFGITRWEKWARHEWIHPRSYSPAPELARNAYLSGACSQPPRLLLDYSPTMSLRPAASRESYSEQVANSRTGESATWYLTLCDDFTNLLKHPAPTKLDSNRYLKLANPDYWVP
jgi:hypothetical protein